MACISACSINTLLGIWAFKVSPTRWPCCNFGFTFSVRTNKSVGWTGADDSSDGVAVLHAAGLCGVTRLGPTGVLAFGLYACISRRTVVVDFALSLNCLRWSYTGHKSISSSSRVARALRLVVPCSTRRIPGTRGRRTHRCAGLTSELARLVLSTVVIYLTLNADARHQWVSLQPNWTHTAGLVEVNAAFGASPTWLIR